MAEDIGRETLQELIKLQISILTTYQEVLDSKERRDFKDALNKVIKAVVDAAGPFLSLQHLAYGKAVRLHEQAVNQTRDLLEKLEKREKERIQLHERMRKERERGR